MLGPILIAVAVVVVIPVSMLMGGAVISGILGWLLKADAEERYEGSELLSLDG